MSMSAGPMSRKVLLVDSDVDSLGALASALRARGLTVSIASEAFEAVEQAFLSHPDVVLAVQHFDAGGDLSDAFRAVPELADTPLLFLVGSGEADALGPDEVLRADVDHVISRITQASPRESRPPLLQDIRGNVEQMPVVDLLQLLAMNRRSGVLGITTGSGTGEVRLVEGEVVDAVFRRLEGEKALVRLLGERDGMFAFSPGELATARRITGSTQQLLIEAMRQLDELGRRRAEIAPAGEALLLEGEAPPVGEDARRAGYGPPDPSGQRAAIARELAVMLQVPRSLDELLDEIAGPDLEILQALLELMNAQRIRRIPIAELTTPLAPVEQLPVLRSLVTRLTRPGFAPPPRVLIAAGIKRMPALAHAVRHIADAIAPADPPPLAALPRLLGTLRLGDGVELAVGGLPTDDTFAPTWALALPGAAAVVRLNDAGGPALQAYCESLEVMLIEAESVMGSVDVAVPGQVAALVRSALEMAAGV
jgi:CheY-like chemotaxis protein